MTPAPGSYREPLRVGLEKIGREPIDIRLAKTSGSIIGMDIRRDLVPLVTSALEAVKDRFECCSYYIAALAEGSVVPITARSQGAQEYWAPGELFFRS